jgi:hypothetical protein
MNNFSSCIFYSGTRDSSSKENYLVDEKFHVAKKLKSRIATKLKRNPGCVLLAKT